MSDYLSRLVSRTLNVARMVQPRVPNRFEPSMPLDDVEIISTPSVERAPVTVERRIIERSDRDSTREMSTVVKTEEPGQPLTPEGGQAAASIDRSVPADGDGDLAEKTPQRAQQARPIVVVRPRPAPAIASTPDSAPAARVSSLAGQQAAVPPLESPTPLTPKLEGSRPVATRVDEPANRGPVMAMPRQTAVPVREAPAQPSITVHIGRIEVRAVTPPPPSPKRPTPLPPVPTLALKDYLKGRRERRR
jgi:hypothetical protein